MLKKPTSKRITQAESNGTDNATLTCRGVSVAFVYTFSLSVWKIGDSETSDSDKHWFEFPDAIQAELLNALSSKYTARGYVMVAGTPLSRKGVLPFFTLDDRRKTLTFVSPEISATFYGSLGKRPSTVSICTRVSNTGVGTCCIQVTIDNDRQSDFTVRDVSDLFRLIKNTWGDAVVSQLSLGRTSKKTSVFKLFENEVKTITRSLSEIGYKAKWVEKEVPIVLPNGEKPFIQPELFASEQAITPYLITTLEFPEDKYEEIFLHAHTCKHETEKNNPVHAAHLQLANILFAIVRPDWGWGSDRLRSTPDLNYLDEFFRSHNGILTNLNMMAVPFVCMGYRSCLIACLDHKSGSEQVMIPSIFDCVEILRMQWHFYILANTILDDETENLVKRRPSTVELSQFIKLREKLAMVLENLETFRWGGNALTTIFNEGESLFELEELRSTVLRKLEILGVLYDDVRELERQKRYSEFAKA